MKPFVEYLIKSLVDLPDQVKVTEVSGSNTVLFELRMAKSDVGKVVGKQGRTIMAIRTLVTSIGGKMGKRAQVEIIENAECTSSFAKASEDKVRNSEWQPGHERRGL